MKLSEWLEKEGLTAHQFAMKHGINPQHVYRILRGEAWNMNLADAAKISKLTREEVKIEDLVLEQRKERRRIVRKKNSPLWKFLTDNNITISQFSAATGVSPYIIRKAIYGVSGIPLWAAAAIVKHTKGVVSYNDLVVEQKGSRHEKA